MSLEISILTAAVCLGLLLQLVLLFRSTKIPRELQDAIFSHVRLAEESTRSLQEIRIVVGECREASRRVAEEIAELRGRFSSLESGQVKTGEKLESLHSVLLLEIQSGLLQVATSLQGAIAEKLVPELVDGNRIHSESLNQLRSEANEYRREASIAATAATAETNRVLVGQAETMSKLVTSVESRFAELTLSTGDSIRGIKGSLDYQFFQLREETNQHRTELTASTSAMREETTLALRLSSESIERKINELRDVTDRRLGESVFMSTESARALNETAQNTVATVAGQLGELKTTMDAALKSELGSIRSENASKLEEMRRTVDEKLHATLEQRLGESFKQVSERLELVHRGLGEMQSLASGVGDLKKVLTNIKTRGTWGEVQLGALLEQILTPEQYGTNIATKPSSSTRVEFAIRLPGRDDIGNPVWLPIDAKFPMEDYHRLTEAQERADPIAVEEAGKAIESRIKLEARSIRERYIDPPHTTDFGILYLPTEGLYAEVLRRPGLAEVIQREHKINVAGPTTLAAMLNSLQMGFRTLAIEKRSSEVWRVLGAVKTEFEKFGGALAHTKKKLEEASNSIENTERRNRALNKRLLQIDVVPGPEAALLIDGAVVGAAASSVDEES